MIKISNDFNIENLYIFHETPRNQYYIPGDSSIILNKAPNIIYRTDFSFYNKSAVATDEYINGDITEWIWPTFYFVSTNWAFNLPKFVLTKQITIPVGSNLNQTELILIPFIHCSNSLFLLEVYDTNNELSAPDWAIVDIYQKTVTLDFNSISKSIKSYDLTFVAKLAPFSISDLYPKNYLT